MIISQRANITSPIRTSSTKSTYVSSDRLMHHSRTSEVPDSFLPCFLPPRWSPMTWSYDLQGIITRLIHWPQDGRKKIILRRAGGGSTRTTSNSARTRPTELRTAPPRRLTLRTMASQTTMRHLYKCLAPLLSELIISIHCVVPTLFAFYHYVALLLCRGPSTVLPVDEQVGVDTFRYFSFASSLSFANITLYRHSVWSRSRGACGTHPPTPSHTSSVSCIICPNCVRENAFDVYVLWRMRPLSAACRVGILPYYIVPS